MMKWIRDVFWLGPPAPRDTRSIYSRDTRSIYSIHTQHRKARLKSNCFFFYCRSQAEGKTLGAAPDIRTYWDADAATKSIHTTGGVISPLVLRVLQQARQSQILTSRPFLSKMARNLDLRCVLVSAPWVLGPKHVSNPE